MKILFLDDSVARTNLFKQRSIGHNVQYAADAKTAITWLNQYEFDLIMLDHDLGEEFEGDDCPEDTYPDGRYVARHMISLGDKHRAATIIIHSLNNVAAQEMRDILRDADFEKVLVIPFAWKTHSLDGGTN